MPLRSRSPGPDASVRVAALLGDRAPAAAGWTPAVEGPVPKLVLARKPQPDVPEPDVPEPQPDVLEPEVPEPSLPATGSRWEPLPALPERAVPHSVLALLRSGRTDLGRRGVLALLVVALVAAAVAGVVLLRGRASEQPLVVPPVVGATSSTAGPEVVVDVTGKVRRPGLVHLPVGSRVDDALKAVGGVLPGVATGSLNLAQKLTDGQQVIVGMDPAGPVGSAGSTAGSTAGSMPGSAGGLLDLNLATAAQFDVLPGIGPVLADKIISWRTQHGRFGSIDQLREVAGIGESKYQALKAKVRV